MTSTTQPAFGAADLKTRMARAIDHTKLTFSAGEPETDAIQTLCREAAESNFYAVCVRPRHIALAKSHLQGTTVQVATVIGFPQTKVEYAQEMQTPTVGNATTDEKLAEVCQALANGVDELDLVLNVGAFKAESAQPTQPKTLGELKAIQQAAQGRPVKVIIETSLLDEAQVELATRLCHEANVFMVKTCTGMVQGGTGATVPVVQRIRGTLDALGSRLEIKASGGIKTQADAESLLNAGATRLGTSSGVEILQGQTGQQSY
jgi:deoxyribose-phosphate aldolase